MKKFVSLLLTVFFVLSVITVCAAQEKGYTLSDAHYILNEDWVATGVHDGPDAPSGWDAHTTAGQIMTGWGKFYLEDTNPYLGMDMKREIEVVSDKQDLTLEYRFNFETYMDGVRVQLRYGENARLSVESKQGNLYLIAGENEVLLQENLETGVEYGVKLIFNQVDGTVTAFFRSNIIVEEMPYEGDVAIDNVYIDTAESATGKIYITPFRLYYNYYVNETFLINFDGVLPQDWEITGSASLAPVKAEKDSYYMELNGKAKKEYVGNSNIMTYSARFIQPEKNDDFKVDFGQSAEIVTSGGALCYRTKDGGIVPFYENYMENVWYLLKVYAYYDFGVCDIWLNGKVMAENVPLLGENNGVLNFESASAATGIDDIEVYPRIEEPEDYVEEPEKVVSSQYEIGMQSCSLWQNGKQFGWDAIAAFPDRKPYLGYYDEPKSEVADWEIKWMSEHGITFQTYCWFRPGGGDGTPIKIPTYGDALNEGFMEAKYSDDLKFTIMFENANSGFTGEADFRQNLVPYWIEYYFKDPRYMTIDNKIVFSFYSYSRLIETFGSEAKVKENMDYLREKCREIGYDGAIIWIASQASSGAQLEACGLDGYYAYNWGSQGSNIEIQKAGMEVRRDNGMDMIPTLAQGWNSEAWDGTKGAYVPLDQYEELANWVKNVYIPSCDDGYAKRVIMLDNWNEFGEGHFMSPSELEGFGYLDIIRKVFVTTEEHTDIRPTQSQLDRINQCYPQNRTITLEKEEEMDVSEYPTEVVKEWDFNDGLQGWSESGGHIKELVVENGALKGISDGSDPVIMSADNLGIDLTDVTYVKLRLKNCTSYTYAQLFFITNEDPTWREPGPVYTFSPSANNEDFVDYWIPMYQNSLWKGTLKRLRFDPFDGRGEFYVDSITLYKKTDKTENYTNLDGTDLGMIPVQNNKTLYLPFRKIAQTQGANVDWYAEEGKAIATFDGNLAEIIPGENVFYKNKEPLALEGAAYLDEEGSLWVSADFIRKAFDTAVAVDLENNVLKIVTKTLEWSFENATLDGWSLSDNFSCPIVTGEFLRMKNSGGDAFLLSPENLEIPGADIKNFVIGLKNETDAKYAKIQYKTESMSDFDQEHSILFQVTPNDTQLRKYVIPVQTKDRIVQLKIVLTNKEGNVEIAYFRAEV